MKMDAVGLLSCCFCAAAVVAAMDLAALSAADAAAMTDVVPSSGSYLFCAAAVADSNSPRITARPRGRFLPNRRKPPFGKQSAGTCIGAGLFYFIFFLHRRHSLSIS